VLFHHSEPLLFANPTPPSFTLRRLRPIIRLREIYVSTSEILILAGGTGCRNRSNSLGNDLGVRNPLLAMLFDSSTYFVSYPRLADFRAPDNRREQNFSCAREYFFYGVVLAFPPGADDLHKTAGFLISPKRSRARGRKPCGKLVDFFSLVLNFSILGTFKYFNFFSISLWLPSRRLLKPLGSTICRCR